MLRKVMKSVIYFECIFVIIPNCESALSKSSEKTAYNYAFDVHLVDSCPVNESDWEAAAASIGCNSTRGYHCVPDIFHSTLIEFCYNKTRISVSKGNCLELSANGILNHVSCQNFTGKCPDTSYFSDKIYEYPVCQNIESGCFTSDLECFREKLKVLLKTTTIMPSNSTHIDCEQQKNSDTSYCDMLLIFDIVLGVLFVISHIVRQRFIFWISKMKKRITSSEEEEERVQLLPCKREAGRSDTELSGKKSAISDDFLYILMELESEGLVENTYLSQLLRRHCRNGTFRNFEYLLRKRILPKKNDSNIQNILTSCDKNGYTLLHCAAEGGSVEIFEELISVTDQIRVDDTTYDGRTVLHIACKNGNLSLCESLMFDKNYKELPQKKKSNQGWNALHYAAANGSTKIVNLLEKNGLDIIEVTTNGLSILDIACLHNHEELCKTLMNRDDLSQLFYKADAQGWTVAHFAAMAGNNDILKCLIKKNVNIKMTTNRIKNVLHVSCEYGNYAICSEILKHDDGKYMLYETDDENWNALHYAAKGGNLEVYKTIEKFYKKIARLSETTCDEKTVLHIACINKRTEICEHICRQKLYTNIINSKGSLKGWTAAHYTAVETKQDGTEEKLIRMLVKSGIDLQAVTTDGLTVLGVACEHRNRNLINYLLTTHHELLGVGIPYLKIAAIAANDVKIKSQINEALENYKGERVNIKVEKKTT